ncbi:hypothetical protein vseg_002337 [Gypsophila vaccaria]
MAVDLLSDTNNSSRGISPRISFSHDLKNCEIVPIEPNNSQMKTPSLLDYDFDFCVSKRSCDQNSSLADELFENGVILPIQIKRKNLPFVSKNSNNTINSNVTINSKNINVTNNSKASNNSNDEGNNDKLFWRFKRSKSLNCGRIYRKGLCSLPLLSRSKSTGSTSSKRSLINNNNNNNTGSKTVLSETCCNNNTSNNKGNMKGGNYQKPPLKKNYGNSFNHGLVQVSPIINVGSSGSLFGFGSLFSNGSGKGKKK